MYRHNGGVPHSSQFFRDEWDIRAHARTALSSHPPKLRHFDRSVAKWRNLHLSMISKKLLEAFYIQKWEQL